jgi:hypothetical protein
VPASLASGVRLDQSERQSLNQRGQLDVAFVLVVPGVPECDAEQLWAKCVFVVFGMGIRCVRWSNARR